MSPSPQGGADRVTVAQNLAVACRAPGGDAWVLLPGATPLPCAPSVSGIFPTCRQHALGPGGPISGEAFRTSCVFP